MSVLLIIVGCLVVLDRLATISHVGKPLVTTPRIAALYTISGAFIVAVVLIAAYGGVTP